MKKYSGLNENSIWIQYALVVLGFLVSFSILTYFSFRSIANMAEDDASSVAQTTIETDVDILNSILAESRQNLETVCKLTEFILQEKLPIAEIESLLVAETKAMNPDGNPQFFGFYGLVKDHFVEGGERTPTEDYDVKKRPWYRNAVRSLNNEIQLTAFLNHSNGMLSVSLSKALSDKESVIAMNLPLEKLIAAFRGRWKPDTKWMVLNSSGDVLSHYDVSQIGENYLSNKYWGTEIEELTRKSLHTSKEKYRIIHVGDNLTAYVAAVGGHWVLVKIYDGSHMADNARWATTRNIMVAVMLFLAMTLLFTLVFIKHRKMTRDIRIKRRIRNRMGHEMHAAINGILGMNAVVMKSIHDEDTLAFSEGVQSAVMSFDSLIKDVREISNNDGTINVEFQEYSLFEVLSKCYKTVLPKAQLKNLQVVFECDPDIPSGMWGDAAHLRQIINNLLSDAVQRTESGSIWVSVNGRMEPRKINSTEDHFVLQFAIRDTGASVEIGRSNNVDEWVDASAELCLAKLMLDACGGELMIKSRYGEGSTFMVSLHQLVLNKAPIGDFETKFNSLVSQESNAVETLFAPSARVLVVDDVEMNLKVVCGLLKETKVQIDTAVSSAQCLELVASKHYDLILLDYSLPEVNGVETFDRMKKVGAKLNKTTPVIMVTAETVDFKDSFLKIGLTDYMLKPYLEKDLLRMLAWYLPKELVLTQEDLQEFPQREKPQPTKTVKIEAIPEEDEEIVFHSILTPEEKLKVFSSVLDIQKGLEYFSHDVRCYYEVVKEFGTEDKRHGFDKTFQLKDWNNYLILIHSVSSVAQAIGANALAAKAQVVERTCKDYKFDLLEEPHQAFMAAYVETMDMIKKGVEAYED